MSVTISPMTAKRSSSHVNGLKATPPSHDHFVRFYESDETLVSSVSDYLARGLSNGEGSILIATRPHVGDIESRLTSNGIDLAAARRRGIYFPLDAVDTLSQFMEAELPDPEAFMKLMAGVLDRAGAGGRAVRAFGEMVAILWSQGNGPAACRLEELWNDLAKTRAFQLYCGYPMSGFGQTSHAGQFADICAAHSRVIPCESVPAVTDEPQSREIAILQQKASALEAEVARRYNVENWLAAIVDSSDDAIISKTLDGIITSWNAGAERIFGYTADEVIGKPKTILFPADRHGEEDKILSRLRLGERIDQLESVRIRKDGMQLDVSLTISPIKDAAGVIVGASTIARDITQAKQQQRELAELNDRLKRSMTETHHRVKNNLQVVSAMLEMQMLEHKGRTEIPFEAFHRLQAHVRTLAVIHDVLTKSIKETEGAQRVCVKSVLDELVPMLQQTAGNRPVTFELAEIESTSKQCVSLALVLNELISNAIKHGQSETTVKLTEVGHDAVLTVCDDGPGFPAGFDPVASANTGLELIEGLVRADLCGTITYENPPKGGACVIVRFSLPGPA